MITVKISENESLDSAIKRWRRNCQKEGVIGDLRRKEEYVKPSVKKKLKAENARKRMYK